MSKIGTVIGAFFKNNDIIVPLKNKYNSNNSGKRRTISSDLDLPTIVLSKGPKVFSNKTKVIKKRKD